MSGDRRTQTQSRILQVASELFLAQGFAGTNLDQVAEAADTTKPTIYNHFGSKDGLLQSVITRLAETRAAALEQTLVATPEPAADLLQFGRQFCQRVLSDESRIWHRFAATESRANPLVGQAFFRAGPLRVRHALARYFADQTEQGRLAVDDADLAAEQFISLLLGMDMIATQIGQAPSTADHRNKRIESAVSMFLAAHCPASLPGAKQ